MVRNPTPTDEKEESVFHRWTWAFSLLLGVLTFLLGVIVIVGWYTGNQTLVQVLPHFVPMQYNTALGFVLCGLSLMLLLFHQPRYASVIGILAGLIGVLTLI